MGDDENQSQSQLSVHNEKSVEVAETSKKIIRLITVIAYLFSVSTAAIMLSLYYVFFWNPTVQAGPERLVDPIQLHLSQFYFNVNRKVCRGSTDGAVGSEIKFAGNDKEKMYEPKHRRKLVRVLTVIAYLFSVSLAAIMLSLFYVFIYSPGVPAGENTDDSKFSQLPIWMRYHRVNQESLYLMNNTHLNLKREEPRALPIKQINHPFSTQSEEYPKDDKVHFNYSARTEKGAKTILNKILKLLKTK